MKDAPFKQGLNSGSKPATKKKLKTIQKGKKASTKQMKEPKAKTKVPHGSKAKKVDKKSPKKIKVVKSKKPDKKIPSVKKKIESKKKVSPRKNTKEQKHSVKKTIKAVKKDTEMKQCRKRKLTEKAHKKSAWGPPPSKMPKTTVENTNRLENGISNVVPQTTRGPWVLKLGVLSTPNGSAPSKNFTHIKKSLCAPKKTTISSSFVKNNLNEALPKENGNLPKLMNGGEATKSMKNKMVKAKKEQPLKKVKVVNKSPASGEQVTVSAKKNRSMPLPPTKSSVSSHPQRMARLDALAKMHVICTTDRRTTTENNTRSENTNDCQRNPKPTTAECKGSTFFCEGSRVEGDVAKHKFHRRINISVAEKEWNFVSQSIQEEESCIDHQNQSVHSSVPALLEQEHVTVMKKKRRRSKSDPLPDGPVVKKSKSDNDSVKGKKLLNPPKQETEKYSRSTELISNKVVKRTSRKDSSGKVVSRNSKTDEKRSKLKETKTQHVKVQETFRMKKTCTYQSVTVNNRHESKSSALPPGHVHASGDKCTNIKKVSHVTQASDTQSDNVDPELPPVSPTMGVHCYAANVPSAEKPVSPASQPVGMEAPDCCGYHSPPLIPLAHAQSCHLGHRMALEGHFDGGFPVHRFQQQHLMYSHPSHGDYGCCCSSCHIHTSYSHVPTHPHLLHSGHSFSSDGLCSGCHHHGSCSPGDSVDSVKRQYSYATGCSAHIGAWCSCYDLNSPRHGGCLCQKASSACMAADYPHQALVPCDQTPLDLSRASSSSSSSVQVSEPSLRPQCSGPLCHTDHMLFKSSRECSGNSQSKTNKSCCRDNPQACSRKVCQGDCGSSDLSLDIKQNPQQLLQLTTNKEHKTVHIIRLRHHHHHQMTETKTSQAHLMGQGSTLVSVTEGSTSTSYVRQVAGCQDFSTCLKGSCGKESEPHQTQSVQSLPCAPKVSPKTEIVIRQNQNRIFPTPKKLNKRKFAHGWSWEGEPTDRSIALTNDSVPCVKKCYPAMRHKEGDIIKERDCVLLRSGSKDTDLPFVAKVAAFWENPEDGEMMMSLLWYYRPEHTEQGRKPGQMEDEVFASKHKDVNSVACIEDKCYVLTFAEYCRYRARLSLPDNGVLTHSLVVPESETGYPRNYRLPPDCTSADMVFFCRSVYDFRQKRILKNPM